MQVSVISFQPGQCGDFIVFQIARNPQYAKIKNAYIDEINTCHIDNYLDPIGMVGKNIQSGNQPGAILIWPITDQHIETLKNFYNHKDIIVTTHWIGTSSNTNFKGPHIKLFSSNLVVNRFSFCLDIIKTKFGHFHKKLDSNILLSIDKFIANGHSNQLELERLKNPEYFCFWKFDYCRIFKQDKNYDLKKYLDFLFFHYDERARLNLANEGWIGFDLEKPILESSGFEILEQQLDIKFDLSSWQNYNNNNFELLKSTAAISPKDLEQSTWLDKLVTYCENPKLIKSKLKNLN
jgi:hypothetical protein